MITIKRLAFILFSALTFTLQAQWAPVLEEVIPVDMAISPEYHLDQTVYIVDDGVRLMISETGGANWVTLYEAADPSEPADMILDIIISPNFQTDNAIVMIHKDGTMRLSPDRGQHWLLNTTAPEGVSGLVFSPEFGQDFTMYCITGALGPVNFHKSVNGGATWGEPVAEITIGGGFYSRLWNSMDLQAKDTFAVQYENNSLYVSYDGGETWMPSFSAQVAVRDFIFSPQFSTDSTMFVAEDSDIYKNTRGGDELSWVNMETFPGSAGIKFAISPGFSTDRTIFAAVDQVGIIRSTDGGGTWEPFNDGFSSLLPVSIAISQSYPYSLFAGTRGTDGIPGKVYRYQSYTGLGEPEKLSPFSLRNYPNPFATGTEITFEMPSGGHATMSISDMTGKIVAVLLDGVITAGKHSIKLDNSECRLSPGIYFCTLDAGDEAGVMKIVVK